MTICIAVKVHDCLVFVADSATSLVATTPTGAASVARVYNGGNKVFNLIRGRPIAAMTCGMGNFGTSSVSTIAKEIRQELNAGVAKGITPDKFTVSAVANYCHKRFGALYKAQPKEIKDKASFGFFVGGYSSDGNGSELWKLQYRDATASKPELISVDGNCTIQWDGVPDACIRLVLGISPSTESVLVEAGLKEDDAKALTQKLAQASQAQLLEPSMPVQDAIDLAVFLAETTVSFVRFLPGADTVGGALDVGTITKFEGFRWIRRKHYYPRDLNRETDHG